MTVVLYPLGTSKVFECIEKILQTNVEYNSDDVHWLLEIFRVRYIELGANPEKFYTLLTLLNMKIFSGYFAHVFNYRISKYTKDRNIDGVMEMFYNPEFTEVQDNELLNDNEKRDLLNTLFLESMTTNLTIKRITLNQELIYNFERTFEESYNDLYSKIYYKILPNNRSGFQDFVVITEYSQKSKSNLAHTYKLIDLLIQCYNQSYSEKLSEVSIQNICSKFDLELKIIEHNMLVLSKI